MSDVEEVQLMVSSDAVKSGSLKRGHKRTGSTGSAKSGFYFKLSSTFSNFVQCLHHLFEQIMLSALVSSSSLTCVTLHVKLWVVWFDVLLRLQT